MHRTIGGKRENFFGKDSSTLSSTGTTSSAYDGLKLSSRGDIGGSGSLCSSNSDKTDLLLSSKLTELDSGLGSGSTIGGGSSGSLGHSSGLMSGAGGTVSSKYHHSVGATNGSGSHSGDSSAVGYSNLPNQVYRKSVRRGFEFNLIVVGESGMGKSTFINSLFLSELYNAEHQGPSKRLKKTVYVEPHTVILKEKDVLLKLTLVDTPGFGDAVDNTNCWQPVLDYVDARFEDYLTSESRVNRGAVPDTRVHACLYFIPPTGHTLKPLDIEFMRRIMDKVNLIPVVAKADTMTVEECRDFKKTIANELLQNKIRLYEFMDTEVGATGSEDEAELTKYRRMRERAPFAVVGANTFVDRGSKVRGRSYAWGTVEVDNLEHNDFMALRTLLLQVHMQDLRDVTNTVLYESYRHTKLSGIAVEGKFQTRDGKDPMTFMDLEKKEHENKMRKMEAEMEQVFDQKVKEKKLKLKESEQDLQRRAEQMKKQLDQQEQELMEKKKQFEAERATWEEVNRDFDRRVSQDNISTEKLHEKTKTEKKKKGLF